MKYQYMPMFWGDFFANTLNLTTAAEVGAYVLLLAHAWEHGGRIPHKDAQRIARIDNRNWRKMRERLEPFFEFETDIQGQTWMYSKRMLWELSLADKLINNRKASGMAGAMKRWGKNNTGAMPRSMANACEPNGNLSKKERKKDNLTSSSFVDAARAREEPEPQPEQEKQESGDPRERASGAGAPLALSPSPEQVAKKAKKRPSEYSLAELMEILDRKRNGKAAP